MTESCCTKMNKKPGTWNLGTLDLGAGGAVIDDIKNEDPWNFAR